MIRLVASASKRPDDAVTGLGSCIPFDDETVSFEDVYSSNFIGGVLYRGNIECADLDLKFSININQNLPAVDLPQFNYNKSVDAEAPTLQDSLLGLLKDSRVLATITTDCILFCNTMIRPYFITFCCPLIKPLSKPKLSWESACGILSRSLKQAEDATNSNFLLCAMSELPIPFELSTLLSSGEFIKLKCIDSDVCFTDECFQFPSYISFIKIESQPHYQNQYYSRLPYFMNIPEKEKFHFIDRNDNINDELKNGKSILDVLVAQLMEPVNSRSPVEIIFELGDISDQLDETESTERHQRQVYCSAMPTAFYLGRAYAAATDTIDKNEIVPYSLAKFLLWGQKCTSSMGKVSTIYIPCSEHLQRYVSTQARVIQSATKSAQLPIPALISPRTYLVLHPKNTISFNIPPVVRNEEIARCQSMSNEFQSRIKSILAISCLTGFPTSNENTVAVSDKSSSQAAHRHSESHVIIEYNTPDSEQLPSPNKHTVPPIKEIFTSKSRGETQVSVAPDGSSLQQMVDMFINLRCKDPALKIPPIDGSVAKSVALQECLPEVAILFSDPPQKLVILVAESVFSDNPEMLRGMDFLDFIDCPIELPIHFVVDITVGVAVLFENQLCDHEFLKLFIGRLTTVAFKFTKIWILIVPSKCSNVTVLSEYNSLVQCVASFPYLVILRVVPENKIPLHLSKICEDAANSAAMIDGILKDQFSDRIFLDMFQNPLFAAQCEFLQMFPTITIYTAAYLLSRHSLKSIVSSIDKEFVTRGLRSSIKVMIESCMDCMRSHIGLVVTDASSRVAKEESKDGDRVGKKRLSSPSTVNELRYQKSRTRADGQTVCGRLIHCVLPI